MVTIENGNHNNSLHSNEEEEFEEDNDKSSSTINLIIDGISIKENDVVDLETKVFYFFNQSIWG